MYTGNGSYLGDTSIAIDKSDIIHVAFSEDGLMYATSAIQDCPNDGDVNEDGKLTAKDAQLAFEYVLGKTSLTSCQQSHADANGNGKVTAADALCIFKAVLNGLSPSESLNCE